MRSVGTPGTECIVIRSVAIQGGSDLFLGRPWRRSRFQLSFVDEWNKSWLLKKEQRKEILPRLRVLQWHEFFFTTGYRYVVAANIGRGLWLRKRTNRLMFWAVAARKNCSRTNFNLRRRRRRNPI